MTGVIYARYSEGPKQTDQSIEGQVADCEAYAREHKIRIIEIYADRHVSGKSIDGRDEFQRMIRDAESHKFDCIITWKIDRFGRNRTDIAINKLRLKKAGVSLHYAKEAVPEGPEGIILESLLEGLAEYYSADLRQKVSRGIRESAKKGKWATGVLPLGYIRDEKGFPVVVPEVADGIREAFQMYIDGAPQADILEMFNARGIRTSYGNLMTAGSLYRMFRCERYLGHWKLMDVEFEVEPIIDEDTFAKAQEKHPGGRRNAAGKAKVEYLLSGKCWCGLCGSMLIGECGKSKTGKMYYYYKCSGRKHHNSCELPPIRSKSFEDQVLQATMQDVLTDETIKYLAAKIMKIQEADESRNAAKYYRDRIADNKKRQKNLLEAIEAGAGKAAVARLNELEAEAEDLTYQLHLAEIKIPTYTQETIEAWLYSFRNTDLNSPQARRSLARAFIHHIVVYPDYAEIWYNIQRDPNGPYDGTKMEIPDDSGDDECSDTNRDSPLSIPYPNSPIVIGDYVVIRIPVVK